MQCVDLPVSACSIRHSRQGKLRQFKSASKLLTSVDSPERGRDSAPTRHSDLTEEDFAPREEVRRDAAHSTSSQPGHNDSKRGRTVYETPSATDGVTVASTSDDIASLDADISSAFESELLKAGDADSMSTRSLDNTDHRGVHSLAAAARPDSQFVRQLRLHDLTVAGEEEEHKPMHRWLVGTSEPWSAHKTLNQESQNDHMLALQMMLEYCERFCNLSLAHAVASSTYGCVGDVTNFIRDGAREVWAHCLVVDGGDSGKLAGELIGELVGELVGGHDGRA